MIVLLSASFTSTSIYIYILLLLILILSRFATSSDNHFYLFIYNSFQVNYPVMRIEIFQYVNEWMIECMKKMM